MGAEGEGGPGGGQSPQDRNQAFLNSKVDTAIYSPQQLQTPRSPYDLMAGTVIAAALVTGLDSDLPGQVIAQVTEDVYDSVTGQVLLVPQGSRLIGKYDSIVAYGAQSLMSEEARKANREALGHPALPLNNSPIVAPSTAARNAASAPTSASATTQTK